MDTATAISANSLQHYQCKYGRVELLNDENYPDWSSTLTFFLTADGTWKVVQGIDIAPPALPPNANAARRTAYNAELQDFQVRSAKACSMIISSLSVSYKRYVFGKTNPKDMWDTLKQQLDSLTSNSGPFIRRDQFLNEKHTGKGPLSAFFAKLQQYQTQLVNTKLPITDFELMSHVLKGDTLDSKYKSIVKTLRLQLDTLTWKTLTQVLINEDIQQAADAATKANATANAAALASKSNKHSKGKGKDQGQSNRKSDSNRGHNSKKRKNRHESDDDSDSDHQSKRSKKHSKSNDIVCFYCCKKGHKTPDCRIKQKAEELQQKRQRRQNDDSSANIAQTHVEEPRVYAHIADSTVLACTTLVATKNPDYRHAYHLDSGATDHIANDRRSFSCIRRLASPIGIRLGDDKII
jgi:ribosomal protein L12E/L44/L45/RPP1/RPP2